MDLIIIPARYRSSRFEAKPLAMIKGRAMILRCAEVCEMAAKMVGDCSVLIATDNPRIRDAAPRTTGYMTADQCRNGTERCAEALHLLDWRPDRIINFQGDMPCWRPDTLAEFIAKLRNDLVGPFCATGYANAGGGSRVAVSHGKAHWFTRGDMGSSYRHVGIYAFTPGVLAQYPLMPRWAYEEAYDLEQMRWIENGQPIEAIALPHDPGALIEVNERSDIAQAEMVLNA